MEARNGIRDDRAELGARSQEVPRAVLRRTEQTDTRTSIRASVNWDWSVSMRPTA
jgi:hypothetical protein